jgi:signal transduction histidine kinase
MNQRSQRIIVNSKAHKSWSVDKDYNSKIKKSIANVLTTNQQFKVSGLGINVIQRCYVS